MADLRQIVGAHQPDEMLARMDRTERYDGVGGVASRELRFDREHANARIAGEGVGSSEAPRQGRHSGRGFQRILRRDEPPDLVEIQALQRFEADMAMTLMRGVEGAAEEADPRFRQMPELRPQGRTWPLPRTTYL